MTNYLLPLLHKKPLANPRLRKIAEHRLAAQLSDPTLLPLPYVIPTHYMQIFGSVDQGIFTSEQT